jgi:extradiol dioxygenase family protein
MSNAEMRREPAVESSRAGTVDMKLEVVIPVSDVDRAKRFYGTAAGQEADQCLNSRTMTTPVSSGSCGLRLVRVASLQSARLTTSPV